MLYKTLTVGNKDYKLVLNASSAVQLEQKLGKNPLNVIIEMANDTNTMPPLNTLLLVLHASLQKYQHGIKIEDVYDIYDAFIEDGNEMADLVPVIVDIFEVSGFFKKPEEEEDNSKNEQKTERK